MHPMVFALVAMSLTAATTPARKTPCRPPQADRVEARAPFKITRLGDMPPARQLLGVYRSVDGCPMPIVIREQVGQPRR